MLKRVRTAHGKPWITGGRRHFNQRIQIYGIKLDFENESKDMWATLLVAFLGAGLAHHFIHTIFVASLTTRGSKGRVLGAATQAFLCIYQLYLLRSWFPLFLDQILAGNILPPACFTLLYFLLLTDVVDAAVPPSFVTAPLAEQIRNFLKILHVIRGVRPRSSGKECPKPNFDKGRFFGQQAVRLVVDVMVPEIIWHFSRQEFGAGTSEWRQLLEHGTEFRLIGATFRQVQVRIIGTLGAWCYIYCAMDVFDCFLLTAAVGLGDVVPDEWPPLFGSLKNAFSVRRFWGKFWHQLLRAPLIGFSTVIISQVPEPWNGGHRVISTFCIFILSGLVHGFADVLYWTAADVHTLPALRFFCASAAVVTLETLIVPRYRAFRAKFGWTSESMRLLERLVGYVWVLFFFCFLTPSLVFPAARILETENKWLLL